MHYPEVFEVDEIREASLKGIPRLLFQATLFDCLVWYVEKRQITIVDTAIPFIYFNHAFYIIFVFLVSKINSRFYIVHSQRFSNLRNATNGVLEGKIGNTCFLAGGGGGREGGANTSSRQRHGVVTRLPNHWRWKLLQWFKTPPFRNSWICHWWVFFWQKQPLTICSYFLCPFTISIDFAVTS